MLTNLLYEPSSCVLPDEAYYPKIPYISIELSSYCNLKCPYCANATLARDYEKMNAEIIERIIEQCQTFNLRLVGFHGVGEPLLRKDLEEILARFRDKNLWFGVLTTNGTLLKLERMKSLYEAGVRFIYNSLDTLDADLYRRTRGGQLAKTIENVKAAAAAFPDVTFMIGLMNHKEQTITPEIERQFWETYAGLHNVQLSVYENGRFPGAAENWQRKMWKAETCNAPASYLTIDARGFIALCCADQNTEHVLGDIRKQTIYEIWYNAKNQETFRNISLGIQGCPDVCFKCHLKPTTKNLNDIEPILYAPISQLLAKAEDCFSNQDYSQSQSLYQHALKREPYNQDIKGKVDELVKLTGIPDFNYFQSYKESL